MTLQTAELQIRRGSAALWTSTNPVLAEGEWGYEEGTPPKLKIGDGVTAWTGLPYVLPVDLSALIPLAQKAAAGGVASLDGTGNVPANQLANAPSGGGGGITPGFDGGIGVPPGPILSESALPPFLAQLDVEKIIGAQHAATSLTIPAYDGSGQSVEPSVLFFPDGWGADSNGKAWRYWMSSSPFTNGNAAFENPSIYVSDDGINWSVPPGLTNPVIGAPASGNNDDPFLYMGPDGVMHLFWNWEGNSVTPSLNGVYHVTSTNGVTWSASSGSAANKLVDSSPTQSTLTMLAPRFAYHGGKWHMWWLDATGGTPFVMNYANASALTYAALNAAAQSPTRCTGLTPGNGDTELWEPEIRRVAGEWWMLFNTRPTGGGGAGGNLWFCTSPDGINWTQSSKPLLSGTGTTGDWDWKVYKGSFVPVFDGRGLTIKIWYSGEGTDSKWRTGYTTASANPSSQNTQVFTATAGGKWRKPAGVTNVLMLAIGAGGGGGSGNLAAAAANAYGGAGGGAGGVSIARYRAADLPDGVYTVGVGAGGAGAPAATVPGNGQNGGAGGGSFVQGPTGSLTYVRALGGAGGTNGFTTGAGVGGAGGAGVTAGGAGANGANGAGATSLTAPYATGGGGAGGVTTAGVAAAGGAGQSPVNSNATAGAAGAIGANGGNGTAAPGQLGGSGGGGGGGAIAGVAGSGGTPGGYGAGGGGGGGAQAPATSSGAGATGAQGAVLVMAW